MRVWTAGARSWLAPTAAVHEYFGSQVALASLRLAARVHAWA
jgi:hypothetical protein